MYLNKMDIKCMENWKIVTVLTQNKTCPIKLILKTLNKLFQNDIGILFVYSENM